MIKKVAVLGLGKVGSLVADLLKSSGFDVTGVDSGDVGIEGINIITGDLSDKKFISNALGGQDAVVSCLPYNLNRQVVKIAFDNAIHYFDLTEDVPTSNYIKELSAKAKSILAPQCGLAPGFIAIAGASLAKGFEKIRSIELRVGALPQSPKGDLSYAFNWSAEGVVNQYLNDCEIISGGEIKHVPAMQDLEKIVIDGITFEAFTTSGGIGTMAETFAGKVDKLNYKTIRYSGHMNLMRFYFHELLLKDNRKLAGEILVNAFPPVSEDVVYVYAAVDGWKKSGSKENHVHDEFVRAYYPKEINGKIWRSISWTTACSIVAVVEMAANGKIPNKGFVRQEDINLDEFLKTKTGSYYAS